MLKWKCKNKRHLSSSGVISAPFLKTTFHSKTKKRESNQLTGSEQAVIGHMRPGETYTSEALSNALMLSRQIVNKILRSAYRGGVIERNSEQGTKGYVYSTKQFGFNF